MLLRVNDTSIEIPPEWQRDSLLHVLREFIGLAGAKYGCGAGLCGACTVLLDGQPARSCLTSLATAQGQHIRTLEGLAVAGRLHPVQQAWLDAGIPQCGYCQSGQILATVALLERTPRPTDEQVDEALAGHLCRCGTQPRVRATIREMATGRGRA